MLLPSLLELKDNRTTDMSTIIKNSEIFHEIDTAWKVSKYGVYSGPNTRKYGPQKTPYLDTFHAARHFFFFSIIMCSQK